MDRFRTSPVQFPEEDDKSRRSPGDDQTTTTPNERIEAISIYQTAKSSTDQSITTKTEYHWLIERFHNKSKPNNYITRSRRTDNDIYVT